MPHRPFLLILWGALICLLPGCASNSERIDRAASAGGLSRRIVQGTTYRHVVYSNPAARVTGQTPSRLPLPAAVAGDGGNGIVPQSSGQLFVFLDGDGRPWSPDGQEPLADPTTRNPLALQLLMQTPAAGIYVSRPCYQQIVDAACSSESWTGGRYSHDIVASIAAAIRAATTAVRSDKIVLIGYSGGGALAPLVAEQLEHVSALVTIAANLDTDAWTSLHRYLSLSASLNPAASDHAHPWHEIHLSGARDTIVPAATTVAYFAKYPAATQWIYADFDHVCCWVEQWPAVWRRMEEELERDPGK